MSREKLLDIEPQELKFCFELYKQAFCTIQLSNNSRHHVAFEVVTADREKYRTQPKVGVLSPRSSCNIQVIMLGPKEVPSDMHCRDEILINSVVASPDTTAEGAQKLFTETGLAIKTCRLRVVYFYPPSSLPSNHNRPQADSSRLDVFKVMWLQNGDWLRFNDWLMKGITIILILLFFWYLMLPLIWSFGFLIAVLIRKVTKRLVFDSFEEWVVRGVGYLFIHLFKTIFWGSENRSEILTRERKMRSEELLNFEPLELKFPIVLKQQTRCSLLATNSTNNYVAFKVMTTDPKKYCVKPNSEIISPRSTCSITVTMQAQKKAPANMQCKDKFLIQSVVAKPGATAEDITPDMFNKDKAKVEECKLTVMYVAPALMPPPVSQVSEEAIPSTSAAMKNDSEVETTVSRLMEEITAARKQSDALVQQLELLKCKSNKREGASVAFVYIIAILGVVAGYVAKRT